MSSLLPLFPLDLVLLPGTPLPLHVFEPRYKDLVNNCLRDNAPFGVVRSKEGDIAEIGCTAEIVTVTKQYDDGRMDIVTRGVERFEVMELNQEQPVLRAEVTYLHDDPGDAPDNDIAQAVKLHGEILTLAGAEPEDASDVDKDQLSFHIAGSLPLDPDFKQSLLGMNSESERLRAVITFLDSVLPSMRRTVRVRHKAGGNGHAR